MGNTISFQELPHYAETWHEQGLKIVVTNGCFDLLHVGHLHTFKKAKEFGDILVVGLNSDVSVRSLKGNTRPVISQDYRAELISALEPVDYVTIFDDFTADKLLETIRPQVYLKGGDYDLERLPEKDTILRFQIEVKFVNLVGGLSTSELIRRIQGASF